MKPAQIAIWMPLGSPKGGSAVLCPPVDMPDDRIPVRVWTLYEHRHEEVKPELPYSPKHNVNAFIEDRIHDWNILNNQIIYRSRISEGGCWILLEYKS